VAFPENGRGLHAEACCIDPHRAPGASRDRRASTAIIWSIGDIVHWIFANVARFQSMYVRTNQWLEGHGIFGQYDVRTFVAILQEVAMGVDYLCGFCIVVFLLLTFGLVEQGDFRRRPEAIERKMGWNISPAAAEIGKRIRLTC
jgi:hypothetical protein